MRAGAGKARIDLDGSLPFDGFDTELDSLWARALIVDAGARCCIVSVEATSLRADMVELLRAVASQEAECELQLTWITVTHTFSSPHVRTPDHLASDDERERNCALRVRLEDAVRTAVRKAAASLAEARLAYGVGSTTCNVNRDVETPAGWWLGHNPEGYSDKSVQVVCMRRVCDGGLIAALFSADLQSSVLDKARDGRGDRVVSGDLAGRACAVVEKSRPGCVALFLTGAAADQAPVRQAVTIKVDAVGNVTRSDKGNGPAILDLWGERFGLELLDALGQADPLGCDVVAGEVHAISLPGQERGEFHSLRPRRTYTFTPAGSREVHVNVLHLGGVTLVGTEPELSSGFGTKVRALAPRVVLATLVNGGMKYLPDEDAYDRITYEAMNSSFGKGADAELLQAISSVIINK